MKIRWSIYKAAQEFGIHRETLAKRLQAQSIRPGKDDAYSTQDICQAVFGDISGEKLRLISGQADAIEMENAKTRAELVSAKEMMEIAERVFTAMAEVVKVASNLEHEDKVKLLEHLRQGGESVVNYCVRSKES